MFDLSWSEILIIGVVALIAIGPKELPGVLRAAGHWVGKVRRMASDFQDQFREAMREAEVADLKRQFDEASAKAQAGFTNPLETAQKEVEKAFGTDPSSIDPASAVAPLESASNATSVTADPLSPEHAASEPVQASLQELAQSPVEQPAPRSEVVSEPLDIKPATPALNPELEQKPEAKPAAASGGGSAA